MPDWPFLDLPSSRRNGTADNGRLRATDQSAILLWPRMATATLSAPACGKVAPRAAAPAHRGRAPGRGTGGASLVLEPLPGPLRLLPPEDHPRVAHPHRERGRHQDLRLRRAGPAPARPRPRLRRLRFPGQPGAPPHGRDGLLHRQHRSLLPGRPSLGRPGHSVLPVGRHLQHHGYRAVLGLRERPLYPRSRGSACSPSSVSALPSAPGSGPSTPSRSSRPSGPTTSCSCPPGSSCCACSSLAS